jgi:hypothetical protein
MVGRFAYVSLIYRQIIIVLEGHAATISLLTLQVQKVRLLKAITHKHHT